MARDTVDRIRGRFHNPPVVEIVNLFAPFPQKVQDKAAKQYNAKCADAKTYFNGAYRKGHI